MKGMDDRNRVMEITGHGQKKRRRRRGYHIVDLDKHMTSSLHLFHK
jgi:hypothetical protein